MIHRLTPQHARALAITGLLVGFTPAMSHADVLLDFTTAPNDTVGDQLLANVADATVGDDMATSHADFTLDDPASTPVTLNVAFTGEDTGAGIGFDTDSLGLSAGSGDQLGVQTRLSNANDNRRGIDEPNGDPLIADESFTFSFTEDITLGAIGFGGLTDDDVIEVTIGGSTQTYSLSDTVATLQAGQTNSVLTLNQLLTAGQTVTITSGDDGDAGNIARFGIASLTVGVVPEPASLALLGLGGVLMASRGRR